MAGLLLTVWDSPMTIPLACPVSWQAMIYLRWRPTQRKYFTSQVETPLDG